jgi:Zn-dependent M16 (insulinase) family peptidase
MKINEKLHGFSVVKATEIAEIEATLYEMEHEKSGAKLLFLDREDDNKTFAITFKTIPEDSTGVFHIIEHSVLCGSKKYTTKEPFVELLKGSLNTFLNAMTFPDKTTYPISSRNDKDFLNLMSVYLDAVLHPAILENPNIFRQEGWHYEVDAETGKLTRSGVVLNEMRGAFSSPDEVSMHHITNMLYPDTCYRHESGGKPENITDLTYEDFLRAHGKYYHPSNSQIFLDGSVNLDSALSLIDSFLAEYERSDCNFEIADQKPIKPQRREVKYEIAPNESAENKTRLSVGYLFSKFDEQEKAVAVSVLLDAICSSNESPLKKAMIDSGLCEDIAILPYDSVKQNALILDFRNVKDGKCDELYILFTDTVKGLCTKGIDKNIIEASLNSFEFKTREKDFGTLPKGIIFGMSVLESSLYGGNPAQNLSYGESFLSLREKLNSDYFEQLLLSLFVNNEHRAMLIMTPSATLGQEKAEAEEKLLSEIKEKLSEKELLEIKEINESLKAWQTAPDSPEDLATIPSLEISDIPAEVEKIPQTVENICGTTVLIQDIATNGIAYSELYFDVSDLDEKGIFDLRILLSLMGNVKTEKHSAIELQNIIKSQLGAFDISMSAMTKDKKAKAYVVLSASVLDSKKEELLSIIPEVLYTSSYTDKEVARNIIRQNKMASDEAFTSGGHMAGYQRASAAVCAEAAINEYYSGYEAHIMTKELEKNFDESYDSLSERLSALAKKIFTKARLTVSATGKPDKKFIEAVINTLKDGESFDPVSKIKPFGIRREGIVVPAQASFAELAANLYDIGEKQTGSLRVVRSLLSYGYLWGAVRVQGGAYGVGLISRNNGTIGFYSFRDPTPERTLGCYKESAAFLREYAKSGAPITNFIIGAIGDSAPLTTPKLKGVIAASRYLRGISYEDECKTRREMLETNADELLRIADVMDKVCNSGAVCVVAGKDKLDTCTNLDSILEI